LQARALVETYRSFCRFCHAVCGIEVDVEDGHVLAVRGDRNHVVSQGYLCVKGRELAEQHTHPSRLRGAKKRTPDGTFVDVARRIERTMRVFALRAYQPPARRVYQPAAALP
jgi:anaerobic selenocysteine-containing dehydrogenase